MEEAAVLSTKVGILANRMLAVGSTEELIAKHATYEVKEAILILLVIVAHINSQTKWEHLAQNQDAVKWLCDWTHQSRTSLHES